MREKLDYMHFNPVKRNLASHPKDWPWSSWSHYEKGQAGLIAIDSADQQKRTATQGKVNPRTLEKHKD